MQNSLFGIAVALLSYSTCFADSSIDNASANLTMPIEAIVGNSEAIHPDIVYFASPWNSYSYWMAYTPYPNSDDTYENPSIVVSSDGITWIEPPGITNPVEANPGGGGFNSDPDLVYNPATDELWLYYRQNIGTTTSFRFSKSSDGVTWSSPSTLLTASPTAAFTSPAVVRVDATHWYLWYTKVVSAPYTIGYRTSSDGQTWSSETVLDFSISGYNFWHVNVDYVEGEYRMLLNAYADAANSATGDLILCVSANGTSWTAYTTNLLIEKTASGWDTGIYRAAALWSNSGTVLDVWYSAYAGSTNPNIGHVEGYYPFILAKTSKGVGQGVFTKQLTGIRID